MNKEIINTIQNTLDYIEHHLYEDIKTDQLFRLANMSQSSFYVVFKNIIGTSVKDYIRKRRLSLSVTDLIESEFSILDIAIKYGYQTYESYSRAFKRLFGISPKKYREHNANDPIYIGFPKICLNYMKYEGGTIMINKEMNREKVLNEIKSVKNKGYILDIDIDQFEVINTKYGRSIGDQVLLEVPNRVRQVFETLNLDLDVVRITGDEFIVIVKNQTQEFIETLSQSIIDRMKSDFEFEDLSFSVTVSIGIHKFSVESDDETILSNVKKAMFEAKRSGRNQYKLL